MRRASQDVRQIKEYDFSKGKRGVVISQRGKTRITIFLDDDILEKFRERADNAGRGYQTMINEALRDYLSKSSRPVDEETLRRVLREELQDASWQSVYPWPSSTIEPARIDAQRLPGRHARAAHCNRCLYFASEADVEGFEAELCALEGICEVVAVTEEQ